MLEQHILQAFISIAFLSKACYYFYHLRKKKKKKGISVKHYFHITSICRIDVELFKFRPWFGSFLFLREKSNPYFSYFLYLTNI